MQAVLWLGFSFFLGSFSYANDVDCERALFEFENVGYEQSLWELVEAARGNLNEIEREVVFVRDVLRREQQPYPQSLHQSLEAIDLWMRSGIESAELMGEAQNSGESRVLMNEASELQYKFALIKEVVSDLGKPLTELTVPQMRSLFTDLSDVLEHHGFQPRRRGGEDLSLAPEYSAMQSLWASVIESFEAFKRDDRPANVKNLDGAVLLAAKQATDLYLEARSQYTTGGFSELESELSGGRSHTEIYQELIFQIDQTRHILVELQKRVPVLNIEFDPRFRQSIIVGVGALVNRLKQVPAQQEYRSSLDAMREYIFAFSAAWVTKTREAIPYGYLAERTDLDMYLETAALTKELPFRAFYNRSNTGGEFHIVSLINLSDADFFNTFHKGSGFELIENGTAVPYRIEAIRDERQGIEIEAVYLDAQNNLKRRLVQMNEIPTMRYSNNAARLISGVESASRMLFSNRSPLSQGN